MVLSVISYLNKIWWIMTKRQRFYGVGLVVLIVFCAFVQMLSVYVIVPLVSAMTDQNAFMDNTVINYVSRISGTTEPGEVFFALCVGIAIVYLIKEVLSIFQVWYSIKLSQKVQRELSKEVFESYMNRDYDFFLDYGTAEVVRDIDRDPDYVYNMLIGFINIFTEIITAFLLVVYVILSDLEMALCILVLMIISLIVLVFGLKRKLLTKGEETRKQAAEKQKILLQSIEGIKEVQVMKKQDSFVKLYNRAFIRAQKPLLFYGVAAMVPTYIIEGFFVIGIVLFIGGKAIFDPSIWNSLPVLASFFAAAVRLLPSVGRITSNVNTIQFYIPSLNAVYDNILLIRNSIAGGNAENKDTGKELVFKNMLELEKVSYCYSIGDKKVLDGVDLCISKGQSIGIVGRSGAGKSTLADLILGLHLPQNGVIKLDGTDIKDIPYEYSRVIGYVPQNVYLVDGTIRENVAFGLDKEQIVDIEVIEALRKAKLYDFVKSLDEGLDTLVGERGIKFSGGQRQRLAIARALYRKPQILILDEATSALDNETETAVMEQVEEMQGSMTLIIIAHRLSTIQKCDKVFEIVDGKAKEIKRNR